MSKPCVDGDPAFSLTNSPKASAMWMPANAVGDSIKTSARYRRLYQVVSTPSPSRCDLIFLTFLTSRPALPQQVIEPLSELFDRYVRGLSIVDKEKEIVESLPCPNFRERTQEKTSCALLTTASKQWENLKQQS